MNRTKATILQLENICVFLALCIIALVSMSFSLDHQVTDPFEHRFLVSGAFLGAVALYLRFQLVHVFSYHRAIFRIAITMMLWSLGLYFFPYPHLMLYLIALPAVYFLARMEFYKGRALVEDQVAAGVLLGLGAFLYLQQQPLQVILFPDAPASDWTSYYRNAPVMIIIGLGFVRLHKHTRWTGLCLFGSLLFLIGLTLWGSVLTKDLIPASYYSEVGWIIVLSHGALSLLYFKNPLIPGLIRFSGLSKEHQVLYRSQLYWILNGCLQLSALYLLIFNNQSYEVIGGIALCLIAPLYAYRALTVSLVLIETAFLVFPVLALIYRSINPDIFTAAFAILFGITVALRKSYRYEYYISNEIFVTLLLPYFAYIVWLGPLSPTGLVRLAIPFLVWILLPGRPLDVPRKNHFLLWPVISALCILCLNQGYRPELLRYWAIAITLVPLVLLGLLRINWVYSFLWRQRCLFVRDWLKSGGTALLTLAPLSLAIGLYSFVSDYAAYRVTWLPVIELLLLLILATGIFFTFTILQKSPRFALITEILLWSCLGLLRWKFDVLELLSFGSPLDGYVLLGAAGLVSGIREVIMRHAQHFEPYFNRSSHFYALVGWAYLFVIQFNETGSLHGETGSLIVAIIYYGFSRSRNRINLLFSFFFANSALLLFFFHQGFDQALFYVIPTLGSALLLAQLFKDRLPLERLKQIRFSCALIMMGSSAFYNVIDFSESLWYPLVAAFVSLVGVVCGISLRIRIYLFLGVAFFFINTISIGIHLIVHQPPEHIKLIIGIIFFFTGILFTGSFLYFQMKRSQILATIKNVRDQIDTWE